jgi:hypothetical protein
MYGLRIQRQIVQTVIFCAFSNKKLVHFVGTIIVYTAHIHVKYKSAAESLVGITCLISNFKVFNN